MFPHLFYIGGSGRDLTGNPYITAWKGVLEKLLQKSWSRNLPYMETEFSLSRFQELVVVLCLKASLIQSTPRIISDLLMFVLPNLRHVCVPSDAFTSVSPTQFCYSSIKAEEIHMGPC
jgi:hypothetical protein